jgi:hypothetical protein
MTDIELKALREEVEAQRKAILAQLPKKAEVKTNGKQGKPATQRINEAEFSQALHALSRQVAGEDPKENDSALLESLKNAPNVTYSTENRAYTAKFVSVTEEGYVLKVQTGKVTVKMQASGDLKVKPELTEKEQNYTWENITF